MTLAVNDQSPEVKELAAEWPMLSALMSGTRAMREQREALLPPAAEESGKSYSRRLSVATLFPVYRRTIGVMSGKPFSKPLTLTEVDPRIEGYAYNIDLQGVSLHSFAAEMFTETLAFGLAGILVEYPRAEPGRRLTVAERDRAGLRPYWVRVRHDQILGWRSAVIGGAVKLTQLRLLETHEEPDGPYGVKLVPQVRVLTPGAWEVWRQTGQDKAWVMADSGTTTLPEIPFVPLYGQRVGFMIGRPPLIDLAYLNVKHWQSQSDQDNILHVARVPVLTAKCVPEDFSIVVGASAAVNLGQDPNAELFYTEHSGNSIGAGETALDKLRDQMVQTGAELLIKRESGDVSATEAGNDAEANKSDLQRIAENYEDALEQALVYTAMYASIDVSRAGNVSLFSDYGAATLSDATAQLVVDLNSRGILSNETTIREMQRRGVISEDISPEDELEKAKQDGPKLGELGVMSGDGQFPPA